SVALDLIVMRPLLVGTQLERGQIQRGFFEELDGSVGLALSEESADHGFPDIGRDRNGDVSVLPGTAAVFPLVVGRSYRVPAAGGPFPPNVVIGVQARPSGSFHAEPARSRAPSSWFGQPRQLDLDAGRLALAPWNGTPWREESARLERLAAVCADGSGLP